MLQRVCDEAASAKNAGVRQIRGVVGCLID